MSLQPGPEDSFRRLVVGAGVSIWMGLILLAVGMVFSCGRAGAGVGAFVLSVPLTPTPVALGAVVPPSEPSPEQHQEEAVASDPAPAATDPSEEAEDSSTPTAVPTATASPEPSPTATATATPRPPLEPPSRLVIPAINLDTPVVEVGWHEEVVDGVRLAVWDVADFAASWHRTSGMPGGGENVVVSGHHNIRGEVFRDIVTLQPGAEVTVYAGETAHSYVVVQSLILAEKGMPLDVRRDNASWIAPTGKERLTLVTCWPYNSNTHRVIVVAEPAL